MFYLKVRKNFSAAHRVTLPDGTPENVHGHNWTFEASVGAETLDRCGMVADFLQVESVMVETVVKKLDHTFLNETGFFPKDAATCELVAKWIYDALSPALKTLRNDLTLERVTLWESPGCAVSYAGSNQK